MTASELSPEWSRLFRTEGQDTSIAVRDGARMSLASAGGGQGGRAGSDTHKASGGPWTAAGGVAGELRTSTQSAITKLDSSHEGLESGTAGFASTAALKGIRSGWKSRLEAVRDHFDKLAPNLAQAGKEFDAHEVKTEGTFAPAGRKSGK